MKPAFRWHRALLALALPAWLASFSPAAAQTPQITSVTPSTAGYFQVVTIRGTNLFTASNPGDTAVEFRLDASSSLWGTVIQQASSASVLYATVPYPSNPSAPPVIGVRVQRGGAVFSNELPFQSGPTMATPVLLNVYPQGGASCAGTPNSTPATSAFPGQWLALAADGLDQYSNTVTFTSPAGTFTANSYCTAGTPATGLTALIPVPDGVGTSGTLQIRVSAGYYTNASPQSNALTLPLATPPPAPVITSIQPNPASLKQMVTITGTNLMIPGGSAPGVTFSQPSMEGNSTGTVVAAASTPTRLFVILPDLDSYLGAGATDVTVGNENGTGASTMQISTTPTAPIIRNIYGFTTPPNPNDLCSGTLNPTPLTQIVPGQAIAIAADGISLANNTITFTATSGTIPVTSPCSLTNSTAGVAAVVVVPASLSGCSSGITIQTMVDQTPILFYAYDVKPPAARAASSQRGALVPSPPSAAVTRILLASSLSAVSLISSLNPSVFGQPVTFTAQVVSQLGCAIPTGTVTFLDGSSAFGAVSLNANASAALSTSSLSPGNHQITAQYSGDALQALSTSRPLTQAVQAPPLNLSAACPASSPLGSLLRIPLMPSGGTGSYQYSYSGPGWLSLKPGPTAPGMLLEGTPPSVGAFPISVTLTDVAGLTPAVFNCVVHVDAPLTMSGACPAPQAVPGVPYSVPVTVSGGSGQYEFFLNGPSWLSLSAKSGTATGGAYQLTLQGTPPTAGSFPFSLQVRDVVGTAYIYSNCSIQVSPASLRITSGCPASQLPIGSAYSFALGASGGTGSYTWSIPSGALPAGLSLNGSVISGTPQGPAATSAFSLRADSGGATGQIDCSITIQQSNVPPLLLSAACPAEPVLPGTSVGWGYTASGGTAPYQFQFAPPAPQWLTLSSAGAQAKVVGTSPSSGTYPVGLEVHDASGKSATASCNLTVSSDACPPLQLNSAVGCPTASVLAGVPYALDVSAAGGRAPYQWSLTAPAFLSLLETGSASARVSGTPPAAGTSAFTVTLADACQSPAATLSCNLTASAKPVPQISFTVGSIMDPLQTVRTEVRLSEPSPVPLVADLVLTFTPNAFGLTDNPRVQFLDPAATNSGRRLRITIPAGSVSTQVPVQPDIVAGLIRIELASMFAGEQNLVAAPYPATEITVPRMAPVITSLAIERDTGSSFDIVIGGYSTPRDMTTVAVTFSARPGKTIDEPSTITVQLADLFRTYYNSAASLAGGSSFSGLRLPVSIDGVQDAVGSISVVLTNGAGSSKAETKSR